jgi:hypothetical protein
MRRCISMCVNDTTAGVCIRLSGATCLSVEEGIEVSPAAASEAPDPGRHHVGILGDIIPESPGGFVGIRRSR